MNVRYIQAVIVGVLVGGAILLAEMIDAGNERGPANAKPSSISLVLSESAEQREAGNPLAIELAQMESMDDPYRRKCFANVKRVTSHGATGRIEEDRSVGRR